jgi:predicted phosphodiesterase
MRFAVISDIRGNIVALRSAISAIEADDARLDAIVCAGDLVGLGPDPNEVIDLLQERNIEAVLGNYDDAVAFDRLGSGRDFPDLQSEAVDNAAVQWTRETLTRENLTYLQELPRDIRVAPGGSGVAIKRNEQDERASEYRRTFFLRAIMGGAFRPPVSATKRVLVMHGSTRALNEFIRGDTAHSILAVLARDVQADVLITGHAASSFRRDAHNVTFIGVGPVDGPGRAEYAIVNVTSEVEVSFGNAAFNLQEHIEAIRASGLPDDLAAQSARM